MSLPKLNVKQQIVLLITIVIIALIVYFTPRYKLVKLENQGYIIAIQGNPLYKNVQAKEMFDLKKIIVYGLPVLILCVTAIAFLRDKY